MVFKFYQLKFLTGFTTEHCRSWYISNIEDDLFNTAILTDVQRTGSKGLDGVASICSNPVLRWAKMSTLGIGVESVIILFGNNTAPVSILKVRGTMCVSWGSAVTCISVMTLVRFFRCSMLAIVEVLELS